MTRAVDHVGKGSLVLSEGSGYFVESSGSISTGRCDLSGFSEQVEVYI